MKTQTDKFNDSLNKKYGPMISMKQMAELLNRSVNGLRASLQKKDSQVYKLLNPARTSVGRRTYFFSSVIAEALAGEDKE